MDNVACIWDLVPDDSLYDYSLSATNMLCKVEDRYRDMGDAYHIHHRVEFGRYDTIPNIGIARELFAIPEADAPVGDITDDTSRDLSTSRQYFRQGDYVRARSEFTQAMAKLVAIDERLDKAAAAIQDFADTADQTHQYYTAHATLLVSEQYGRWLSTLPEIRRRIDSGEPIIAIVIDKIGHEEKDDVTQVVQAPRGPDDLF